MFHTLILAGRMGRDSDLRYTPNGKAVTNLSIATDRKWTDGNGVKQSETIWFRVTVWGATAENAVKYLKKGAPVLVEGRLQPDENGNPRTWVDNSGEVRTSFEVVAGLVKYLPNPKAENQQEDIPFDLEPSDDDGWADL